MEAPFVEPHLQHHQRGNQSSGVAQAIAYDLQHADSRNAFNVDAVLDLPEPMPKSISPYEDRIGYVVFDMLPEVIGCKYDSAALAAIRALRPSVVRTVVKGQKISSDAVWWRVTVHLDQGVIMRVQQECKVVLPLSCMHGRMLKLHMNFKDERYDSQTGSLTTPTYAVQGDAGNAGK